nr:MAG TPA: hypothetical protein [Caudoviricetes sp.]
MPCLCFYTTIIPQEGASVKISGYRNGNNLFYL